MLMYLLLLITLSGRQLLIRKVAEVLRLVMNHGGVPLSVIFLDLCVSEVAV